MSTDIFGNCVGLKKKKTIVLVSTKLVTDLNSWREMDTGEMFELSPEQQEFRDITDIVWEEGEEAYA